MVHHEHEGERSQYNSRCYSYTRDGQPIEGGCTARGCRYAHPWNTNFQSAAEPKFTKPHHSRYPHRPPSPGDLRRPQRPPYAGTSANSYDRSDAPMSPPSKRPRSPDGPTERMDKRMRVDDGNDPVTVSELLQRIVPPSAPALTHAAVLPPALDRPQPSQPPVTLAPPASQPPAANSRAAVSPPVPSQSFAAPHNVSPSINSQAQPSLPNSMQGSPTQNTSEITAKPVGGEGTPRDPRLRNRERPIATRTMSEMSTASALQLHIDPDVPAADVSVTDMTPVSGIPTSTGPSTVDLPSRSTSSTPRPRPVGEIVSSIVRRIWTAMEANTQRVQIYQERQQMKGVHERFGAAQAPEDVAEYNTRLAESRAKETNATEKFSNTIRLVTDGLYELAQSFFEETLRNKKQSPPWIARLKEELSSGIREDLEKRQDQLHGQVKSAPPSPPLKDEEVRKRVGELASLVTGLVEGLKKPPRPDPDVVRRLDEVSEKLENAGSKQAQSVDGFDARLRKQESKLKAVPRDADLVRQVAELSNKVERLSVSLPPPGDENLQRKVNDLEEQLRTAKEDADKAKRRHEEEFRTFESRLDTMQREMDRMRQREDTIETTAKGAAEKAEKIQTEVDDLEEECEIHWGKDFARLMAEHEELRTTVDNIPPAPTVKAIVDVVYERIIPSFNQMIQEQSLDTRRGIDTLHDDITKQITQHWSQVEPLWKFVRLLETFGTQAGGGTRMGSTEGQG